MDYVVFNNATAQLANANNKTISLALKDLIEAATDLVNDAEVLNS
jgi:hypothetical protein